MKSLKTRALLGGFATAASAALVDSGSTTARNLYCGWNVDQAGIFTSSFSMTATVHTNGTISGAGATVG